MRRPPPPGPRSSRLPGLPFWRVPHRQSVARRWFASQTVPLPEELPAQRARLLHICCKSRTRPHCRFRRKDKTWEPPWSESANLKADPTTTDETGEELISEYSLLAVAK